MIWSPTTRLRTDCMPDRKAEISCCTRRGEDCATLIRMRRDFPPPSQITSEEEPGALPNTTTSRSPAGAALMTRPLPTAIRATPGAANTWVSPTNISTSGKSLPAK